MGSEWGLGPLRIGGDNSRSLGDRLARREQAPKATAGSPPAAGSGSKRRSTETPGARFKTRAGRANRRPRTRAPHERGALGEHGRPGERSDGESDRDRSGR